MGPPPAGPRARDGRQDDDVAFGEPRDNFDVVVIRYAGRDDLFDDRTITPQIDDLLAASPAQSTGRHDKNVGL